jgi:hypothetical protein
MVETALPAGAVRVRLWFALTPANERPTIPRRNLRPWGGANERSPIQPIRARVTKRLRIPLFLLATLLLVAGVAAIVAYRSVRQVPEFYLAAIEQDEAVQAEANDECLRQAAALASDVQRPGYWQADFSVEQINGWLAVDLEKNYPHALPEELENPRVDVHQRETTLAFGYRQGEATTIVSIKFDLYLNSPNVVAVRVRGVRAGLLPVPLSSVLEGISTAARNFDLELEWRQSHGDPVALIKLPPSFDEEENEMQLDSIEFGEGTVHVAGRTVPAGQQELARAPDPLPAEQAAPETDTSAAEVEGLAPIEVAPEREALVSESAPQDDSEADPPAEAQIGSATKEKVQR